MVQTNFTAMSSEERAAWVQWARSHDWGDTARIEHAHGHAFLTISDRAPSDPFGGGHALVCRGNDRLAFGTPRQVRDWAGY